MSNLRQFTHQSVIPVSMEALEKFHAAPEAFKMLAMPPILPQIISDRRTSLTSGALEFRLWIGPIPVYWLAEHEPGPTPHSFVDRMVKGPMSAWRHEHTFETVSGGTRLTDRITFTHRPGLAGLFTRLLFDGLPLKTLFMYRHWRTHRQSTKVSVDLHEKGL